MSLIAKRLQLLDEIVFAVKRRKQDHDLWFIARHGLEVPGRNAAPHAITVVTHTEIFQGGFAIEHTARRRQTATGRSLTANLRFRAPMQGRSPIQNWRISSTTLCCCSLLISANIGSDRIRP